MRNKVGGPGLYFFDEAELSELTQSVLNKSLSRYSFGDHSVPSNVQQFEREISDFIGVSSSLGMNSCTSALYCGLLAAGVGPGDEILLPGYAFVADIAAIVYTGATPVFVEIDTKLGMDPVDLARKIGPLTKAVVVVHMLGHACAIDQLASLAKTHGILLIEDVAQAMGGSYEGRQLGSFGDMSVFSLNMFKIITAGDGGILATTSEEFYNNAFAIHDHGVVPYRNGNIESVNGLGLNFRMHELIGTIARVQLRKLPSILNACRTQRQMFLSNLDLPKFVEIISRSDGDCGSTLVLQFLNQRHAQMFSCSIESKTLDETGRHCYHNMPLERVFEVNDRLPNYLPRGYLPQTDDVLKRSVALSIGVVDDYLGTGIGIDLGSTRDEILRTAEKINLTLNKLDNK